MSARLTVPVSYTHLIEERLIDDHQDKDEDLVPLATWALRI